MPNEPQASTGAKSVARPSSGAQAALSRAVSSAENQEIFVLPRQKSRSRERNETRMFLVDGQLCWTDSDQAGSFGGIGAGGKRNSSMGLLFGSSMDLSGMSMGHSIDSSGGAGSGNEEAISYRIKWCRENIMQLKRQTWPMEKKLQVLKASKLFIKQHQGELKQSKQAKDVIASGSAIFDRYWRHFKREFANFLVIITPWEMRIKKIESHFGSVVASYFTFLRWIFWLNLANSLVMVAFVMVPELIENVPDSTGMRKGELGMQQPIGSDGKPVDRPEFNPTLGEMWEFEGFLKFSPIFYGYYSNVEMSRSGFWRNPLAFLLSAMLTYLFCFFCISRKLSQNTKLSRIGSKDDEYTFCWTVFVGWDFMIGNSETAYNKTSSLVMNLKEGILEEKEQTKDRNWRLIIRRVMANVLTLMLIVASAYVVTLAVQRSENLPEDASLLQKNELQLVMSGIQFMFPPLFDVIGIIEKYHPRKALSWQLGRILFLDFLNFYTLMFSLFGTVDQMGNQLNEVSGNITLLRKNTTYWYNLFTTTTTTTTTTLAPETTTALYITESSQILTDNSNNTNSSHSLSSDNSTSGNGGNETTTTTNQPTSIWLKDVTFTSEPPAAAAAAAGGNLNVSTILTSVLLASSTVMPSNNAPPMVSIENFASTSTTMGSTISGEKIPNLDIAMTPIYIVDPTTTTPLPPEAPYMTTREPIVTSSSDRPIRANTEDTDQDYPDLGEVLGRVVTARYKREVMIERGGKSKVRLRGGKRRKVIQAAITLRRPDRYTTSSSSSSSSNEVLKFDQTEREESPAERQQSEELSLGPRSSSPRPAYYGNYIPQIQDPYRKVGVRNNWHSAAENYPTSGREDEEEEPLEGRLEPNAYRVPTTRKPKSSPTGIARPIGGVAGPRGSRVQMTKPPILDDDTNEDILDQMALPTDKQQGSSQTNAGKYPGASENFNEVGRPHFESTEGIRGFTEPTGGPATPDSTPGFNPNAEATQGLAPDVQTAYSRAPDQDFSAQTLPTSGVALDGGDPSEAQAKSALVPNPQSESNNRNQQEPLAIDSVGGSVRDYHQHANSSNNNTTNNTVTTCGPPPIESSTEIRFPNGTILIANLKSAGVGFNASEITYTDCVEIPDFKPQEILGLNDTLRDKLKSLCWETMFGQEMVKIVVMDLVMTVISAVSFEFMRACFVRYCNRFFFWDLERGFPGYQDFKIAENVLHLVNNQSTVWMGMFFAPGLPAINTVKLAVLMYVRSWAVLTCNIPHETVFKVSKSNNFYYWILLINLLICILPVAYAVTWIRPSWHCGPFGGECRMYLVVTKLVKSLLPPEANTVFKYITSPGAVIPILISLILIIYYLASTVSSSKEANKELKAQLKKDKEQEAAVPEITNTTVADATPPGASVPATSGSAAATTTSATTSNATVPVSVSATLNPNNLAPASSEVAAPLQSSASESRPKSLLMPPPL